MVDSMRALEIARKLAQLNETAKACEAYTLALHESDGTDPGMVEIYIVAKPLLLHVIRRIAVVVVRVETDG